MRALVVVLALGLSGCATIPTAENISESAKKIQSYTRLACSFVPTITTIANILSRSSAPITAIAADICAAVTTAPLADGGPRQAKVNGVVIRGRFVK